MYYIGEISEGEYGKKIIELWNGYAYGNSKQAKIELKKLISKYPNLQIISDEEYNIDGIWDLE